MSTHVSQMNWTWIKQEKVTSAPKKWHFLLENEERKRKEREHRRTGERETRDLEEFLQVSQEAFLSSKSWSSHFQNPSIKLGTILHLKKKLFFPIVSITNFWLMLACHIQLHQRSKWKIQCQILDGFITLIGTLEVLKMINSHNEQ